MPSREVQLQDAVREPFSYGGSKAIYEALLLASTELPAEVGQLCLELANRRDLNLGLGLTRFGGHPESLARGAADAKNTSTIFAGVSPTNGRPRPCWT
jgi:hypothetical protein